MFQGSNGDLQGIRLGTPLWEFRQEGEVEKSIIREKSRVEQYLTRRRTIIKSSRLDILVVSWREGEELHR